MTSDLKSDTTTLVSAGTSVIGRSWAVNTYDEGRPTDGTATVKDQVTRTITGVQVREHPSIHGEQRTTQTVYDWLIALPVKSIQDPDGLALTSVTKYDSQGRVRKEIPPAATGTDAATRVATYWSASGSAPAPADPSGQISCAPPALPARSPEAARTRRNWSPPPLNTTGGAAQPRSRKRPTA